MNEDKCAKASTNQIITMALGITALVLLMLVSITGAAQSTNIWFHKGSELISSEKYNEAIKAYDKAIEINPHDSLAWYNKGLALDKLNKHEEAMKAYDKAIEIDPRDSTAWYNKGTILGKLGKDDITIEPFDKSIESNPQNQQIGTKKGLLYLNQRNTIKQ